MMLIIKTQWSLSTSSSCSPKGWFRYRTLSYSSYKGPARGSFDPRIGRITIIPVVAYQIFKPWLFTRGEFISQTSVKLPDISDIAKRKSYEPRLPLTLGMFRALHLLYVVSHFINQWSICWDFGAFLSSFHLRIRSCLRAWSVGKNRFYKARSILYRVLYL